ncbi:MAG TPA: CHASE sensor domain-containing protein, partial [Candidatus Synoicihabitans sp.]|nr:CHASE sensor domain-containing protein [Candidatus Synoicihabitans sp.]
MFAALSALWLTGGALFLYELFGYQAKLERDVATLADIIGANSAAAISFGDRRAAAETLRALRAEPQILEACLFNLEGERLATFTREDR